MLHIIFFSLRLQVNDLFTKLCFSSQTTKDIITKDYYDFVHSQIITEHLLCIRLSARDARVITTLRCLPARASISLWGGIGLNVMELYISENVSTPHRKSMWMHVQGRGMGEGSLHPLIIINAIMSSIDQTHHRSILHYWASTLLGYKKD